MKKVTIAGALLAGILISSSPAAQVVIQAYEMTAKSANIVPADATWSYLSVCYGGNGHQQWTAEVKQPGKHYVHFRFSSGERRPCRLSINGKQLPGEVAADTTGGFYAEHLAWKTYGPFDLVKGKNTIRLDAAGHMPHFRGLVVSPEEKLADKSVLGKIVAAKIPASLKSKPKAPPRPRGASTAANLPEVKQIAPEKVRQILREQMPDADKIVFVKRINYSANHYYTEYINSAWTPGGGLYVLSLKDGAVTELVPELNAGVVGRFDLSYDAKKIVFGFKKGPQEGYRIYEVGVDGDGLRQLTYPPENEEELVAKYRVSGQYHHGTDDMHPCYLPDGGIAFISTRCQYGILCDGPDNFTTTILYRMDADGKNMQKLTNSSVSEASPAVLPDGRIMYTRWEYVNKGAVSAKCLWAMRADGSASSEIYANDISLPPTFIYGRPIPDAPNKYVVLGTPHYPQTGVGTVIRLDMTKNIRTRDPMTYMTPCVDIRSEGGFHFRSGESDAWRGDRSGKGPLFKDPYPLSEKYFLVSHKPAGPQWRDQTGYDLYLLDETGAVGHVYSDAEISCWQPYPLRPRKKPPVLKSTFDAKLAKANLAVCVVTDVYHGLEDVERGTIKHVRVLEQVPRPWKARRRWGGDGFDQQHACVSMRTALGLKVQHGIVPVEEDGSAHFVVPANKNVFFQVLDENYMAVQTERTYVNYLPGEKRSCVGCHETPNDPPASTPKVVMALTRPPSRPGPQPGETTGNRPLHYPTDVQPVLDRHCIKCHGGKEPKAGMDLTGEPTAVFSKSYEQLLSRRLYPIIGENHPKTGNIHYLPARSLGSHNSLLVAIHSKGKVQLRDKGLAERAAKLIEVHKDVKLAPEELLKITNWVDTNGQYYGSYYGRRNLQHKDHPNFRPVPSWTSAIGIPPLPEEER